MPHTAEVVAARLSKRTEAVQLLRAAGVSFTIAQRGGQFVVHHEGRSIDYWPGTDRWRPRSRSLQATYTTGLQGLLQHITQGKLV